MSFALPLDAMALLTLLACSGGGGPPDDLSGCDDFDCRVAWLVAHWESDQARVLAEVQQLGAGPERLAAVQAIAEAHPGKAASLCEVLVEGSARTRCEAINQRPHLWEIDLQAPTEGAQGSGKVFTSLTPTQDFTSPWASEEPLPPECPADTTPRLCATEQAWRAAMEGRSRDAGRLCLNIEAGQWQYECFFEAAERAFDPGVRGTADAAVTLCLGAGPYLSRCLGHVSTAVAASAPAAGAGDRAPWERLNRDSNAARRALDQTDPGLGARYTADAWARTLAVAYSSAPTVTGHPLDVVEPHAVPHVRAAAAWRLVQLHGDTDRSLVEWQTMLDQALLSREQVEQPALIAPGDFHLLDHWVQTLPGEDAIQWVPYLVGQRRALPADPASDAAVCLLEAAAQDSRKHPKLFQTALQSEDPLVRWTAARLMRTQKPSRVLRNQIKADSDALVRGRTPTLP